MKALTIHILAAFLVFLPQASKATVDIDFVDINHKHYVVIFQDGDKLKIEISDKEMNGKVIDIVKKVCAVTGRCKDY